MAITEYTDDAPVGTTITTVTRRRTPVRIPARATLDPAWAELEQQRVWTETWQLACTLDHVANPGDCYEYTVGKYSVLIVRGDDGVLRAFQNVCRHRGNELCHGAGSGLTEIRCVYHRWSWDLQGDCARCRHARASVCCATTTSRSSRVLVDTWGRWCSSTSTPTRCRWPSTSHRCPTTSRGPASTTSAAAPSSPCRCRRTGRSCIEAFSETYHVQGIHREMLPMCDDVNSPQAIWEHHGRLGAALRLAVAAPAQKPRRPAGVGGVHRGDGRRASASPTRPPPARCPRSPPGRRCATCSPQRVRDVGAGARRSTSRCSRTAELMDLQSVQPLPQHHGARVPRPPERHPGRARAPRPTSASWIRSRSSARADVVDRAARHAGRRSR